MKIWCPTRLQIVAPTYMRNALLQHLPTGTAAYKHLLLRCGAHGMQPLLDLCMMHTKDM